MARSTLTDLKLTLADFEQDGRWDCSHTFTPGEDIDWRAVDVASMTSAQVADTIDWGDARDWIEQQDEFDGIDPMRAYAAWKTGYRACAIEHIEQYLLRKNPGDAKPKPARSSSTLRSAQKVVTSIERDAGFPKMEVSSKGDVVRVLRQLIGDRSTEFFAAIYVNSRNTVVGYDVYTTGSPTSVEVNPRGIIANAIGVNAAAIISAHNHPSGVVDPSPEDHRLWDRLNQVGSLMGVPFLDHLVIAGDKSWSLHEHGGM